VREFTSVEISPENHWRPRGRLLMAIVRCTEIADACRGRLQLPVSALAVAAARIISKACMLPVCD